MSNLIAISLGAVVLAAPTESRRVTITRVAEDGSALDQCQSIASVRRLSESSAAASASDTFGPGCSNIYATTVQTGNGYLPGASCQMIDYGCSNGGLVCDFDIGYFATFDAGIINISFYSATSSSTCPGTFVAGFNIANLPGDGGYVVTVTLQPEHRFNLPSGNFGYGYALDNGLTYIILATGGTCSTNGLWRCPCVSETAGGSLYMRIAAGPSCTPPSVVVHPAPRSACVGGSATFAVVVSGPSPSFQWRRGTTNLVNGGNISGATAANLMINPVGPGDAATNYNCVVTNTCNSATSNNGTLTVYPGGGGDINGDSRANGNDIRGFVQFLLTGGAAGTSYCAGDMNASGTITSADVPLFVNRLLTF